MQDVIENQMDAIFIGQIDGTNHSSSSSSALAPAGSTQSYSVCSLSQLIMPSVSLPPLQSMGAWLLSFPQNLRVGKPWISRPATSLRVESTFTSMILGLLLSFLAASSQWGARVLQCPHHGAQNLTRTSFSESNTSSLKFLPTPILTGSLLVSGMGEDLRYCSTSPAWTFEMNEPRDSPVNSPSKTYLSCFSPRQRTLGVVETSTPMYSASLSKRPWPSSSDETVSTTSVPFSSRALKASLAAVDCSLPEAKRNKADFLFWKIFSMAWLSNGMTSHWAIINIDAKSPNRMVFIFISYYMFNVQHDPIYIEFSIKLHYSLNQFQFLLPAFFFSSLDFQEPPFKRLSK